MIKKQINMFWILLKNKISWQKTQVTTHKQLIVTNKLYKTIDKNQ